jgi:hypothetical protein
MQTFLLIIDVVAKGMAVLLALIVIVELFKKKSLIISARFDFWLSIAILLLKVRYFIAGFQDGNHPSAFAYLFLLISIALVVIKSVDYIRYKKGKPLLGETKFTIEKQ